MTSISTNPHSGPLARSGCLCILVAVILSVLPAAAVRAQTADTVLAGSVARPRPYPERAIIIENDDRSGPRLGAAYLIGGSVSAERLNRKLAPLTTLFGWQVEHRFDTGPELPELMTEVVVLAGGVEQGLVLPSGSVLVAIRQPNGWEAGIGPTVTGAGVQLAIAIGETHHFGEVNVPVNLAVTPGRRGASISITTGFNTRRGG